MKKKSPLLLSGIALFISALMLTSVSVAWFSMNKKTTANNSMVGVGQSNGVSYTFYRYDTASNTVSELQDTSNITLNEYDRIFTNENENTPLIVKIEAVNTQSSYISQVRIERNVNDRVDGSSYSSDTLRFTLIIDSSMSVVDDGTSLYEALNSSYYNTVSNASSDFSSILLNSSCISSKTFSENSQSIIFDLSEMHVSSDVVFLYIIYDKRYMEQLQVTFNERNFINDFTMLSVVVDSE